jgi:hypothetical protein
LHRHETKITVKTKSPDGKVRLNLEVTTQVKNRLERLQEVTESASFVEVIRKALALLETVVDGQVKLVKPGDGKTPDIEVQILAKC